MGLLSGSGTHYTPPPRAASESCHELAVDPSLPVGALAEVTL
ncbi:hypothetical protein [Adlercreutzia faecimuris]|nr:hypothetical protein [Adlercreutzia sp. JBNU-10]